MGLRAEYARKSKLKRRAAAEWAYDESLAADLFSDHGWALTELGRFDEAQPILERAAQLAPPGEDLPAKNLARLRQLREERGRNPNPQ